jgi:hypothetical protein
MPDGNVIVGAGITFDQAIQALEHARRVIGGVVLRPAVNETPEQPAQ